MIRKARAAALTAMTVLITAATGVAFAESFRGLYGWAATHSLPLWWALVWPLMVDVFVAVGELALFVSVIDGWDRRSRWGAWVITGAGLAASVAGNMWHLPAAGWQTRLTDALPPVAAACALAVGLGVLKRATAGHAQPRLAASVTAPVPGLRRIQREVRVGQDKARQIQALVKAAANGHGAPGTPSGEAGQ